MDVFIRNFVKKCLRTLKKSSSENLLKLLSAIEYMEAILEMTAARLFGKKMKWLIILVTQLSKCAIRLTLLVVHKIGIQTLPSLFEIKNFLNNDDSKKNQSSSVLLQSNPNENQSFFTLNHSGRVIRTIENSPASLNKRDWSLSAKSDQRQLNLNDKNNDNEGRSILDPSRDLTRYFAEILHIIRPICHLTAIFITDSKSWLQFVVPFSMDSIRYKIDDCNAKKEMKRRAIIFLAYFMRSPVYDNYSSSVINVLLSQFEQQIPGLKIIIKPIKDYIPYWRSIYNYCWAS